MFNIVILTGRLTADPELKTTPNGVNVCSFSIAVDRRYNAGEEKQTDFINIVTWRGTAEFVSKYFQKGKLIGIEGSIQTRRYQDKDGNNRTAFEVVANNVQFIESKGNGDNSPAEDTKTPQGANFSASADNMNFTEVEPDEDLPF